MQDPEGCNMRAAESLFLELKVGKCSRRPAGIEVVSLCYMYTDITLGPA